MTYDKKLPKIALGAWAWGNDNTFGGELSIDELCPIYDEAMDLFIYESSKRILKSANEFIITNNLFK